MTELIIGNALSLSTKLSIVPLKSFSTVPAVSVPGLILRMAKFVNPHMHEIFLQRYCMKWVPGDPLKEMIN